MYVFVYGTLKSGEPNHEWLTQSEVKGHSSFVAKGVLVKKYPLVIASKFNIPFLMDSEGIGKHVNGEVYEIDEKMLANLDVLEAYPQLYTRREEEVNIESSAGNISKISAWTYFLKEIKPEMLELPFLDIYNSLGPHNLPYHRRTDELEDAKDI